MSKATICGRGRHKDHTEAIERFWKGLPVEDAKTPLRVIVKPADIETAQRKDPEHCVFANACKRLFDSSAVVFLRSYAYVDLPNEKGERIVNRFRLERDARAYIKHFDKTGLAGPGGFLLSAPPPSQTLEAGRQYSKARRQRIINGQHKANGTYEKAARKRAKARKHPVHIDELLVRDGMGMVSFRKSVS